MAPRGRYWTWLSRRRAGPGRPRVDREIRELIRRMALENDWGAPRIHGELEKLGFTVSEATVSRYMPRRPAKTDVVQRWLAFLRNHKEGIAAMDFFTVPTPWRQAFLCSDDSYFCALMSRRRGRWGCGKRAAFSKRGGRVRVRAQPSMPRQTAGRG